MEDEKSFIDSLFAGKSITIPPTEEGKEQLIKILFEKLQDSLKLAEGYRAKLVEEKERNAKLAQIQLDDLPKQMAISMNNSNQQFKNSLDYMRDCITCLHFIPNLVVPLSRRYPGRKILSWSEEKNSCYILIEDNDVEIGVIVTYTYTEYVNKFKVCHDVIGNDFVFDYPREGKILNTFEDACVQIDFLLNNLLATAKPYILKTMPE